MDSNQFTPADRKYDHLPVNTAVIAAWRTAQNRGEVTVPGYLQRALYRMASNVKQYTCFICEDTIMENDLYTAYEFHGWTVYSEDDAYCEDCYFRCFVNEELY